MSFTINRKEMLSALNKAKPGLSDVEFINQSTSFVFKNNKVSTYNDEIGVSVPVDISIVGAIPAKETLALLQKSKAKELLVEITDNEFIIKTKKSKASLRFEAQIELPFEDVFEEKEIDFLDWKELDENVLSGISMCKFSAAKNHNNELLNCIHFTENEIQTCDNFRFTIYKLYSSVFKKPLLISAETAKELPQYDIIEFAQTDNWAHFRTKDGVIVSCRMTDGTFPDITKMKEKKTEKIIFPDKTKEIVGRASVFVENDSYDVEFIEIQMKKGIMKISAIGSSGSYTEKTKSEYKGGEKSFFVNPLFLKQMLDHDMDIYIGENTIEFKNEGFEHVIALVSEEKKK